MQVPFLFLTKESNMITLTLSDIELFDEATCTFNYIEGGTHTFEHSLQAISEWESIYKKPFLSDHTEHSVEEMQKYCTLMCIDGPITGDSLSAKDLEKLLNYIKDSHTATKINTQTKRGPHSIITSEVVYAMMVESRVPIECELWNINRLLVLLNVLDARRNPKKMSVNDIYKQNNELNRKRREQMNSRG